MRRTEPRRTPVDAVPVHFAGGCLDHGIRRDVIRARSRSVSLDMAINDRGFRRAAIGIGDFQLSRGCRRQVVHDNVGAGHQLRKHRLPFGFFQVDADAFFAAAISDERAAGPASHHTASGIT